MKFVKSNILIIWISLYSILVLVNGIDLTHAQRDEATPYLKLSRLPYCQTSMLSSSKCSVCSTLDDMEHKVRKVQSKTIDGLKMTMVISQSETETVITFGGVKSTQMQKVQSMYTQPRMKVKQLGNIAVEPLLWKIYSKFRGALHKEIKNAKSNVIFAGHSLGGNIAAIAAIDIKVNKIANESTTYALYTFGALKMGPRKIWHGISKMMKSRILRVRKKKDLVTIMPRCILEGNKFKCFPKRSELVKAYPQYRNHYKKIKGERFGTIKRSNQSKKRSLMKQYKKKILERKKIERQLKQKPNNKKLRKKLNRIKKQIRKNRRNIKKLNNQKKKKNTKEVKKAKKQKNVIKRTIKKFNKKVKKIANNIKKQTKRLNKLMKKKMTKARRKLVKKIKKQIRRFKKMKKNVNKQIKKAKKKSRKIMRKIKKLVHKTTKKIKKRINRRKQRRNQRRQNRKSKRKQRRQRRKQKRQQKKLRKKLKKKERKAKKNYKKAQRKLKKDKKKYKKLKKKQNKLERQLRKLQQKGKGNSRKARRLQKKLSKMNKKVRKAQKQYNKSKKQEKKQKKKYKKAKQKSKKASKPKKQSKIKRFFKRLFGKKKKRRGRFLFFIQHKMRNAITSSKKCINRGKYIECEYQPKTHSTFWKLKIENCK